MSGLNGKPIEGSGAWGSHRLLSRWLDKRTLEVAQERKLAKIALETGSEVPRQTGHGPLIGSPAELRGIPAVGPRVGGAVLGTRPGDTAYDRFDRLDKSSPFRALLIRGTRPGDGLE